MWHYFLLHLDVVNGKGTVKIFFHIIIVHEASQYKAMQYIDLLIHYKNSLFHTLSSKSKVEITKGKLQLHDFHESSCKVLLGVWHSYSKWLFLS
jgi:hypothetical protein